MNTIEKIRAEIERRMKNPHITFHARGELLELLSFLSTLEESKKCDGCNNVKGCVTCVNGDQWAHYEESEKPMNLEKEIEKAGKDVLRQAHHHNKIFDIPQNIFDDIQLMDIFKSGVYQGYELGKQSGDSEIPNDLEEAAVKWSKENTRGFVLKDKTTRYVGDTIDAFIAGAKWQKEQDLAEMAQSKSPLSVAYANRCFENGKQAMKEQMMKEAVEGEVVKDISNKLAVTAKINLDGFKFGDKVRVIIVKEN